MVSEDFVFLFFTTSVHPSSLPSGYGVDAPFGFSIVSFSGSSTFFFRAVSVYVSQLFAKPAMRSPSLNDDNHLPTFVNYDIRDFLEPFSLQADKEGVFSVFYASAVFDGVDLFNPPV